MAPSAAPKSSHTKSTSEKQKSEPKTVATLKVTSKTKVQQLPPAKPVPPPAKPPSIEPASRAKPTKADDRSLQSVKPPPVLPPPPPPVLEWDAQGNMTYQYSRHHTHTPLASSTSRPRHQASQDSRQRSSRLRLSSAPSRPIMSVAFACAHEARSTTSNIPSHPTVWCRLPQAFADVAA
jgi:hypothetical protein